MSQATSSPRWTERRVGDRSIWVGDGLYSKTMIDMVFKLFSGFPYYRIDTDRPDTTFLHLRHEWDVSKLPTHPLLSALLAPMTAAVEERYAAYEPTLWRAYALDQTYGDVASLHTDSPTGVTALYYANAVWEPEWDGETMFYDGDEAVAAVAPRPGRVTLFPADMGHRSGTPSRVCEAARRAGVFKFKTKARVP